MAGYNRKYKMSNNAADEYDHGAKPYDEWTKGDIIDEIMKVYDPAVHQFDINYIVNIPLKALKMCALSYVSWHHMTLKYKITDFYAVDKKKLLLLTNKQIEKYVEYVESN